MYVEIKNPWRMSTLSMVILKKPDNFYSKNTVENFKYILMPDINKISAKLALEISRC